MFYAEVERAFISLEKLKRAADELRELHRGSLRIASMPAASLEFVPFAVKRFSEDNPGVSLSFQIRSTQQVADLSGQLKTIDDDWKTKVQGMQETLDSRKKLVDELEARSKDLNAQLTDAQSELRATQAKLGDENNQVLMRYMVYGGSIAGAGLLVGLILPALTRGRKRNDRWF